MHLLLYECSHSGVFFGRLEDAYTQSQGELKRLLRDSEAQQEKLKLHLAELQREVQGKNTELEELRRQVNWA